MMEPEVVIASSGSLDPVPHHEFVIIGGGVCGIYAAYEFAKISSDLVLLEAHADLGGTWYKNRYPGCRFDSESYTYGYSFSSELLQEWSWSEQFAGQPETLEYLNYVVDRFDLRRYMQFNSQVASAAFDEGAGTWLLTLTDGRRVSCRYLATAVGLLSAAINPRIPGLESYQGLSFHTYDWPEDGIDLAGKRVGIIGTGSTAVQIIPSIADAVAQLTVFQLKPNWCVPLNNGPISLAEMEHIKTTYAEIFAKCDETPGGFVHGPDRRVMTEVPVEERFALWEKLYQSPGFGIWLGNFREILMDEDANAEFSAFVAQKIRDRVLDPVLAEKLIPTDHGFGVHRVPMETNYYEAYNRDNVLLIDLQDDPIESITPTGIRTKSADHDFDVIIYATGFDAITGAYDRIDFRGSRGLSLREKWTDGPITYLGVQIADFPNLVMLGGPHSASVATNFPRAIETSVKWAAGLFSYMRGRGFTRVETTHEAEEAWTEQIKELYQRQLLRKAKSWFTGYNPNIPGHDRTRYLIYTGGAPRYRRTVTGVAEARYEGFAFDQSHAPDSQSGQ